MKCAPPIAFTTLRFTSTLTKIIAPVNGVYPLQISQRLATEQVPLCAAATLRMRERRFNAKAEATIVGEEAESVRDFVCCSPSLSCSAVGSV